MLFIISLVTLALAQNDTVEQTVRADQLRAEGDTAYYQANYCRAIDLYEQALIVYREIGDRHGEAASLNNLGVCYKAVAEYERAIDYYEQSLAISQEIGDRRGASNSLNNLGVCYRALAEYERAIDYYEQSLAIQKEIGNRRGEAASLDNLGICYWYLAKYRRAGAYHEQSLPIFQEIDDRRGEAYSLDNLGSCYWSLAEYEKAIAYHEQSWTIFQGIGYLIGIWRSAWGLERSSWKLQQLEEARSFFEQALDVVETIRGGITAEALRHSFFTSIHILYEEYLKLLLEMGQENESLTVAERCRARMFLDLLAVGPVGTIENVAEEGIRSGVVDPSAIEADVDEVARSLPSNTAALEYFVTDDTTYVWVIYQGEIQGPIQLKHGRAELMHKVIETREQLGSSPEQPFNPRNLVELYDWLIRPVEHLLPKTTGEGNVPHLIIIPSGPLYYLPFQALIWTSEDLTENNPFIARYALSYSPSLATLKYAQALTDTACQQVTFLALADPDFGDLAPWAQLPGAREEAEAVANLFVFCQVYVGTEATEDAFYARAGDAVQVLLSTHGHFDPLNPMFSYLLLSPTGENDGKLHAHEIFSLPLRANMVVLSACETLLPSLAQMTDQLNKIARRAGDDTPKELTEDQLKELTAPVLSVAFSSNGRLLASCSGGELLVSGSYSESIIRLWDVEAGKELHRLTGHTRCVNSMAFSPDGKFLASGTDDKTIKLWNVGTGEELWTLAGRAERVCSVAFSPDGGLLISLSADGMPTLWKMPAGRMLRPTDGHTGSVKSMAFSPDGRLLASGSEDEVIILWNVETAKALRTLTGHTDCVASVAFSPDGNVLASGSRDGTVLLWDVDAILHSNELPIAASPGRLCLQAERA
jgi:CHAT domain-containing protein/Tfp pilus assembly protein PilF